MRLIAKATADNTANIDWALPPGFDRFRIVTPNFMPATDGAILWLRMSTDGGSNYATTAYVSPYFLATGTYHTHANGGTASIVLTSGGSATGEGGSADGILTGAAAGQVPRYAGKGLIYSTDGNIYVLMAGGYYASTDRVTHLRLLCSSGNIASGDFYLYGE